MIEEITFDVPCPFCKKNSHVTTKKASYDKWKSGTLVQHAFPEMSADTRELLLSGICPPCWDKSIGVKSWA